MAHAPDGTQRLTLRLDPPELGHVQIRIDRPADAPARVDITVERTETLTLLLRDQPQLQRALDQAGVPPDGRSVTFHVAATEAGARYDGDQGPAAPARARPPPAMLHTEHPTRAAGPHAADLPTPTTRVRISPWPPPLAGCAPASTSPPDMKGYTP
jgi:flagellar hook-length control protein FliK